MLKLRDIMTRDVVTVDPQLSIRGAMELLATRHLGGVPVVSAGAVVGIISMTDLMEFAAGLSAGSAEQRAEPGWDGMDRTARMEGDADAAFFADLWSGAQADAVEQLEGFESGEWRALEEHTVSEAMTRDVRALSPTTDVVTAASVMTEERIHRVLVMADEELLGIVSLTDIAKAVASHRLSTRTFVFPKGGFDGRSRYQDVV